MKYRSCQKCNNGFIINYDNNKDPLFVFKCNCLKEYQTNKQIDINFKDSNLSLDTKNYSILSYKGLDKENNLKKINKFIVDFEKKYYNVNLYFYGGLGTQKTTLSKYICYELIKKQKTAYYTLTDELIKTLLKIERDEKLEQEIEKIINKDILILDEISTDKCTWYKSDYQAPFLTSFLKRRLERIKKSTIFISNYTIKDLYDSKFGNTIADLINRECSDTLCFKDNYNSLNKQDIKNLWD